MLLPATHFPTFPPSSSSLHFLPFQLPKTKSKFLIRCSQTQTLSDSAIQRIADKLRSLGITDQSPTPASAADPSSGAGEIFVPLPQHLPNRRVGHTIDPSWAKQERREERVPTLAELSLSNAEIRRLTTAGLRMKQKLKVGKAGITEGIVNGIHERWRSSEVVRVVCEDLSRFNMKRTHDLLERKTGGLVVWRSGSKIILYRGTDYKYPYFLSVKALRDDSTGDALQHMDEDDKNCDKRDSHSSGKNSVSYVGESSNVKTEKPALIQGVGSPNKLRFQLPGEAEFAKDADCLLAGIGPRFIDWWGYDPLPVDADLLPAVIPGYRKPFRLLPYGVKPKLTDDEMTTMRRLGNHLPCHFALGRNRKLQGLAAAIIKFWERCEIVKIAIKRGVQNTDGEVMAEEIKHLTGGTLLARDKEFIVFYRGKDFLPAAVSSAIEQRRSIGMYKLKTRNSLSATVAPDMKHGTIECDSEVKGMNFQNDTKQGMLTESEAAIKNTSVRLSMALEEKAKAEKLLAEMEKAESSQEEINKEGITEEERYMLRRIALKMGPFLLLGRRGAFDGTVENMHLHWKYRELVKIICNKQLSREDVQQIAQTLEAESGGILISVERVKKGYAIIVYRGKNYSRPASLRPRTLLNRKQALVRFKEAQRCESLKLHVLKLDRNIDELKHQMAKDMEANSKQISADNQQPVQEQPVELIYSCAAHQAEPENSLNWNSTQEAYVYNQQTIPEQSVELVDSGEAHQSEPENSINCNSLIEASVDNQQAIQGQPVERMDSGEAHQGEAENNINWNSPKEPYVDYQQAIQEQPVELIDGGGAHQDEPESWSSPLDGISDSEHCVSISKVMESSVVESKRGSELSAPLTDMSSNEFPCRSVYLSNRERLLLRKQALLMKKRAVLSVGKSNIVTGLAKAIKAHFQKHPLAIVNVKGRAKGTSIQEVVSKLEQATGAVLVSQELNKVILYRGWGEEEKPSSGKNVNKVDKEGEAKPRVSPELLEAIRVECGLE
ncbi:hypothetical protein Fmac_016822 [Flemingia macrophylla]|uniref:CRM domain-containing protein n=1 Tax=Flemingia macrophylla TaxID=520843 RepID=A0ABD1MIH5_9FABA